MTFVRSLSHATRTDIQIGARAHIVRVHCAYKYGRRDAQKCERVIASPVDGSTIFLLAARPYRGNIVVHNDPEYCNAATLTHVTRRLKHDFCRFYRPKSLYTCIVLGNTARPWCVRFLYARAHTRNTKRSISVLSMSGATVV